MLPLSWGSYNAHMKKNPGEHRVFTVLQSMMKGYDGFTDAPQMHHSFQLNDNIPAAGIKALTWLYTPQQIKPNPHSYHVLRVCERTCTHICFVEMWSFTQSSFIRIRQIKAQCEMSHGPLVNYQSNQQPFSALFVALKQTSVDCFVVNCFVVGFALISIIVPFLSKQNPAIFTCKKKKSEAFYFTLEFAENIAILLLKWQFECSTCNRTFTNCSTGISFFLSLLIFHYVKKYTAHYQNTIKL